MCSSLLWISLSPCCLCASSPGGGTPRQTCHVFKSTPSGPVFVFLLCVQVVFAASGDLSLDEMFVLGFLTQTIQDDNGFIVLLYSYPVKWPCATLSVNYSEFDSDNVVTPVFFISLVCGQNVLKKHSK